MPIFLAFTVLFAIYLNYKIRKSYHPQNKEENILDKEARANFTRKKDISHLNYIVIPFDKLPFQSLKEEYRFSSPIDEELKSELLSSEKSILSLKDKKILNLTGISNTDLKLTYGVANLSFLMQYDENFSKLSRDLGKWGKLLYKANEYSDAKSVLEFAVSLRSDIEDIFITLGKIYKIENNLIALSSLKTQLDCFDEGRRVSLAQKLDSL